MTIKKISLIIYLLTLLTPLCHGQDGNSLSIQVLADSTHTPISSASIYVSNYSGQTDSEGIFIINSLKSGIYRIQVEALGFEPFIDTITKYGSEGLKLTIPLREESEKIEGITVIGNSENEKIKQAPIRTVFIDTRAVSTQAISLTDLMNRNTGIRIRQNGAVGSRPEISINGFQGKSIKYFKDGIPMDFLGEGYNLTSLPVEMLDHIEVYKGVLPVSLGADALGGAVNLVSDSKSLNKFQGYYEIGSFDTHRLGIITSKISKDQKWGYGAEAYFNYSKNNYKALVDVINPETRNPEAMRLPMFHNAYKHYLAEIYASIRNRGWADELKFSLIGFDLKKEQQHPSLMTDAYGALHSKQNSIVPSLRYKLNLFDNKFRIDQYSSFNILQTQRIDTIKGRFDWFGNYYPGTDVGESRLPSNSKVNENQWVSRTNISYLLSPSSKIELNYVFTSANRSGLDPLGPRIQGTDIDILSLESNYKKQVLGIALENNFLGDKIQNQIIGKYYSYQASGYQNTWFSTDVTENDRRTVSSHHWGVTEGLRYLINNTSLIRGSLEYTYRLPDREELFGNNVFIVPNFELRPERSLNINLGFKTKVFKSLTAELNGFYRNTDGLILLVPIQSPNAQYQNQEHVRGYGVDLDLNYHFGRNYRLYTNATYQDLRLFGIDAAQDAWKNNARLRNTPYFFANAGASLKYENLIYQKDELDIFFNYNFMREFYLETIPEDLEPGGFLGLSGSSNLNSNLIIPNQHLLNLGFSYGFLNNQVHISGEVRNILNKDLYDYYRVQRPGRSIHLKLSYRL